MIVIGLALVAGCSSDSDTTPAGGGGGGPTSNLLGAMLNGSEYGSLSITIASATLAPLGATTLLGPTAVGASASFRPVGGAAIALSGSYDVDTDTLTLAGSGYALTAWVEAGSPPSFNGQYTGPNGPGFTGAIGSDSLSLTVFCGTYMSNTTSEAGNMAFLVSDTTIAGVTFSSSSGNPLFIEGTMTGTGTTRTITAQGGDTGVLEFSISGTYNTLTGQGSGTWHVDDLVTPSQDDGTWSVSLCP